MEYKYDLFLSFKNSTSLGLTEDREIADSFFMELTQNNFKVFYSNQTLSEKGTANYMLEIQNALETSKSILIIFSKIKYISKGWVAQEWMTFLNLSIKDPNRNIYIFSIKNNTSKLPPFLRPFECFCNRDMAITHITNGIKKGNKIQNNIIGKRDFLNAYWGLFGNTDINDYMDKKMADNFYNYKAYYLKTQYINGEDIATYIKKLSILIKEKNNPLAMYLLSRFYRNVEYLDLDLSTRLRKKAFKSFRKKIENSSRDSEISLWILLNEEQYDGAFYMCDLVHDVLDAYNIKTEIKLLLQNDLLNIDFNKSKKIVLFWSDVCIEISNWFIDELKKHKDKVIIGLNSFGEDALAYDIKCFEKFENNHRDITRICRILLS